MAPSGELRGKGRRGVFAGKTVWSTPARLRGEVLTTRRYTNLRLPLPFTFNFKCYVILWYGFDSRVTVSVAINKTKRP